VGAAPAGAGTFLTLRIVRDPGGEVATTSLDLTNEGGVPFAQATGLVPCAKTCADLGIPVPFAGGQP
jgi:hypothetical protein